jgi:hypothetical protein
MMQLPSTDYAVYHLRRLQQARGGVWVSTALLACMYGWNSHAWAYALRKAGARYDRRRKVWSA